MLDLRFIREQSDRVKKGAADKGYSVDIDRLLKVDEERREILQKVEFLRKRRNELSDAAKGQRPSPEQIEEGKQLKVGLAEAEDRLRDLEAEVLRLQKVVPNIPEDDVPVGASEDDNVVVLEVGEKPHFDFTPKNHAQIAEAKGWLDKERAAKVAGSRFAYVKGDLAKLHFALVQFGVSVLTDRSALENIAERAGLLHIDTKPFQLVLPPLMIRTDMYDAMDRLEPREDRYKIEGEELWLQGSAEHVLGSMHANEVLAEEQLPLRYIGYATSFRKEAGTYGKDMEGIFRMHQFDKLEMESLTTKQQGRDEHLFMIAIQEYLMATLGLPYRVIEKCTADIGKPNAKGVDIDVWLPGQNKYRETHTADWMTDYQSRRLQTRVRRAHGGELELVHTNDATVLSQRPLIAIIENYQTAEGDIRIPEALQPYFGGTHKL